MKLAIPTTKMDESGNITCIEYHDTDGNHIIDSIWDENEEQTTENRKAFKKWSDEFVTHNKGYEVQLSGF